ncbi:MAG: cytochrome b/b6 domain-containing protein [Anaerolineaceae bacterium]|nr:cytochrome b/b6 domain-containing protein [Anaerolineaceae bacterium]
MNKKQKTNWWIDLLLFISFLTTFFLQLTGLIVHQWIGIVSIAIAAFHLLLHRDWVKTISKRFFHKRFGKARLNFVIDLAILFGFAVIGLTGVVMSTWLNLPLPAYDAWRQVHITGSVATLVVIMVKIGLHLRWIEQTTRKILVSVFTLPARNLTPQPIENNGKPVGRREFLVTMGMMSTAAFIALASASKSLAESLNDGDNLELMAEPTQTATSTETATPQATATAEATAQSTATAEAATQTPTVTATPMIPTATVATESSCTVRCDRGCAYPGHCRRYTDANGNGLCDLGECL